MRQIAEFVAVVACGLFTGAALYVSFVEHPARMECGVEIAMIEFPPSYRRATVMQAILAALGVLFAMAAWLAGGNVLVGRRWSFADSAHMRDLNWRIQVGSKTGNVLKCNFLDFATSHLAWT